MESFFFTPDGVENCRVSAWLQPELTESPVRLHPAMVICPGGGYGYVSDREGEPVAKAYYAAGYSTFVLHYSVGERAKNFEPLSQLAATVAYIRKNAEKLHIDITKVVVCGFSAGGHLAASLGVLYNDPVFLTAFPQTHNIRPDAMVLGYPVITTDEYTHEWTIENISGGAPKGSPEYAYWGLHHHVDAQTPPTFLWHTAKDRGVPPENSLKFASALSKAKVPFELHIFPYGDHGNSVCTHEVDRKDGYIGRWVQWSIDWLGLQLQYVD